VIVRAAMKIPCCLAALLAMPMPAPPPAPLVLAYNRHAAYHDAAPGGGVAGLMSGPLESAFRQAGVPFEWRQVPLARQREMLRQNREPVCVVGALRLPEREEIGKFSHPFYRGLPVVAMGLRANARLVSGHRLRETLEDPQLVLLAKNGYSFGPYVSQALEQSHPRVVSTNTEVANMVAMLVSHRADYLFMAEDAFMPLVRASGFPLDWFKIAHFSDAPGGNARHLWCSARVDDAVLARLNAQFDRQFRSSGN
jgi:polar amino acid transport system substrate-binding protein